MWIMVIGGLFPALGTLRNYLAGNLYEGRAAWIGIFANPNEVAYALVILVPLAGFYLGHASRVVRAPAGGVRRSRSFFAACCFRNVLTRRVDRAGCSDRAGWVEEKE